MLRLSHEPEPKPHDANTQKQAHNEHNSSLGVHGSPLWVELLSYQNRHGFYQVRWIQVRRIKGSWVISNRDLFVEIGAGGRDRTGTGLVSPRDFKLGTDPETIESYLYESEEYHNGDLRFISLLSLKIT